MNIKVAPNCTVCKLYKRFLPNPGVAAPVASKFTDVIAMDFKLPSLFNNVYFIHFIDLFTRFSKTKAIRSREPKVIVKYFITIWIAPNGCTEKTIGG